MIWSGTDIIIDVMHLNHLKTTFRPSPGPWKNCPLVHGAKKFRDCCFGPSSNGIAVAVMLEMGRWWKSTPCPFSCEQSPPGHCLLNTEDQWLWVSELLRFQCGLGVSLPKDSERLCYWLEVFWPLLLLVSASSVHLSSPCLSVPLHCSMGSLLFLCPLPFLYTPDCC